MYDNPELRNTPIGVQPYVLVSPRLLMPPQRNLSMPLTKTPVYDAFWRFAAERQNIYMKRVQGLPRPWTDDPILDTYKFTNCYRASDRVSQYLIRNVIYRGDQSAKEVFFRTILFKMFNRIETWEWLNVELDEQLTEYDLLRGHVHYVLQELTRNKSAIYTSAYMTPSPPPGMGSTKWLAHLQILQTMFDDGLPDALAEVPTMGEAFRIIRQYPMIGDFLAYQFVTDLAYCNAFDWSEMEFTVPGPGALDGIHKCFSDLGGISPANIIRMMTQLQQVEFAERGLEFQTLWGRPLQLIDVQNVFCEISKYARVAHPDVKGKNNRTRIKAKHTGERAIPDPWFPPKWGINDKVEGSLRPVPCQFCNRDYRSHADWCPILNPVTGRERTQ